MKKQRLDSDANSSNNQIKGYCYKAGYELAENIWKDLVPALCNKTIFLIFEIYNKKTINHLVMF